MGFQGSWLAFHGSGSIYMFFSRLQVGFLWFQVNLSGTLGYAFILVIMRMMYMVGLIDGFITLHN